MIRVYIHATDSKMSTIKSVCAYVGRMGRTHSICHPPRRRGWPGPAACIPCCRRRKLCLGRKSCCRALRHWRWSLESRRTLQQTVQARQKALFQYPPSHFHSNYSRRGENGALSYPGVRILLQLIMLAKPGPVSK